MNIVINNALTRTYTNERGNRQVVYFTLADDNDVAYNCVDDLPAEADAQDYLDARIENELLFVRQEEYSGIPIQPTQDETRLEAAERWIAEGHKVQTGTDSEGAPIYRVIEKKAWRPRF